MKKVAVVVLNYKVSELILKCIDSIRKSDYENLLIIVVDNNSGDGVEQGLRVKGEGSRVIFIQNKENLGYTGGNNEGIKKALDMQSDYVFILNPDTIIKQNTIRELVAGGESNQAGIIGPKIYFENSKKIWFAGGIVDINNVLGSHKGVDEEDSGQYDKNEETEYVTGAAMMVKSEVFKKIGLFDEKYFLYYEDSDFCFRARKAGFKIMYIPKAVVFHANAKSTGLGSPLQDYFITRNRMLFAKKFLSFRTQLALFREAIRNLGNPVRRLAFFDFLTGNFEKGNYLK